MQNGKDTKYLKQKIKIIKYIFNIMKNLIKTILLIIAIYSGAVAANSDDVDFGVTVAFSVASLGFVITNDKN